MGPSWGRGCGCLAVSPQRWAHRPVVFRDQCLTPSTRGGSYTHVPLRGQGRAAQREVQGLAQSPWVLSCDPWPTGALRLRIGLGGALSLAGPPCSVSSGASRPLTQDLCPLWCPGLCGVAVGWRVDGPSGRQLLCRLERSLLADGGTSRSAPRVPSSLRRLGAFSQPAWPAAALGSPCLSAQLSSLALDVEGEWWAGPVGPQPREQGEVCSEPHPHVPVKLELHWGPFAAHPLPTCR